MIKHPKFQLPTGYWVQKPPLEWWPSHLRSYHYKHFIPLQVPRYSNVSRIMNAYSYAWMFVNLQQRQTLQNFSLTYKDRVAQLELEYPNSIVQWSFGCIGIPWIKSEQVTKVIWKTFSHMVGCFNGRVKLSTFL